MKIYLFNADGWFTRDADATPSPLDVDSFLVPGNATLIAPPQFDPATQLPKFDGTVWTVLEAPAITKDKADKAAIKKAQDDRASTMSYKERRFNEYPPMGDQLDALYKARQGDTTDLVAIDAKIAAVKAKYPKPVGQQ